MGRLWLAVLLALPAMASPIMLNGGGQLVADEGPPFMTMTASGTNIEGDSLQIYWAANYYSDFVRSTGVLNFGVFSSALLWTPAGQASVLIHRFRLTLGDDGYMQMWTDSGQELAPVSTSAYLSFGPRIYTDGDTRTWGQSFAVTSTPEPATFLICGATLALLYAKRRKVSRQAGKLCLMVIAALPVVASPIAQLQGPYVSIGSDGVLRIDMGSYASSPGRNYSFEPGVDARTALR